MRSFGKTGMKRTTIMAAAIAAVAGSVLAGSPARAEEDCNWYALTSAKQQQANEQKNCGFSGDGWTTDTGAHMNWCQSVSPDEWRNAVIDREKKLKGCG